MTSERICPDCGAALPADAPRGLCSQCLMGAALSGPVSGRDGATGAHEGAEPGVLATIAQTLGAVPRVLLRDTTPGEEPGPIVTPVSLAAGAWGSIRYRIDGEIARGGMGTVLKGRDPDLGRDVALKVLRDDYRGDATMVRRFVEEAQIGGQLQHPGIVPIYELGTLADRRPFFAMKLVKGHTLAELLAQRPDPAAELPRHLAIFEAVCQTMAYAHARGVIHRDLKPSNVMVGSFGEVQVMDWGVAKVLPRGGVVDDASAGKFRADTVIATARSGSGSDAEDAALSHAGSVLGTPSYMAPEQARGEVDRVDQRADVFALGSILCEVLTGAPAFTGRSSAAILRTAALGDTREAMQGLETFGADLELIGLAKDCLAREREDRPHDAGAVSGRMTAYLAGVQARLRQAELAHAAEVARTEEARATVAQERKAREEAQARAVAERRTRRLTGALAATVVLGLTAGGGGWLWVKSERGARQARVARDVQAALNRATALRAQALSAATGSAALFAQAREQAQRALALVENGPADALLAAQVLQVQADLDQEEKDRTLIAALDEARLKQAETVSTNRFASERAVPVFREAFRAYGMSAGEGDPRAVAGRIRQRPAAVREAIVAALDEWDDLAGSASLHIAEPHREWLQAVLGAIEPDEAWSRRVRAARAEKDEAKRRAALEKLAASADVTKIPARSLTGLADRLPPAPRAALLRRAQAQYPADFWVNQGLGLALAHVTPPEPEEAVRFLTTAAALRPQSPGCLMNLGHALQFKGRLDEAIATHRKAIELDPKYTAAHINLGNALRANAQIDEAIAAYRQAIALAPKIATARVNLGLALAEKGQADEAIASYRQAIELDPKSAAAYHGLGVALRREGQADLAIATYREAIALDPKDSPAHYGLGAVLCDLKRDYDAAIASFRRAIELDPKYAEAHHGLGIALQGKGQTDEAIASFRKAVELDPKDASAQYDLGALLGAKGQVDEGIARYRQAIALNPKNALAHYNLGQTLRGKGVLDEAVACYRKTIELDSTFYLAHSALGLALQAKGQVDEAIACFRKAIELEPKFALGHHNLGTALQIKGQLDEAIACQRKAIELDPKHSGSHLKLGTALQAKGQLDEAIACYRMAIELDPKSPWDHLVLGGAMRAKGQWDEAIACFRKAIELAPKSLPIQLDVGNEWLVMGQLDEAIACYRRAVELNPKSAAAHIGLGLALKANGQLDEAIACFRKAIELDPKYVVARAQLEQVQRLAAARDKLPAFQDGSYTPASNEERLDLAEWCRIRRLYFTSTRLYADAFGAAPRLAAGRRYHAACSAVLAAAGKGEDAATRDDLERARLRKQALDWLRADLAVRTNQLDSATPAIRDSVLRALLPWQHAPDLAGIRDPAALAQLPEEERKELHALWAEVEALIDRAGKMAPSR
jgi:serine/threonine-protein kinase